MNYYWHETKTKPILVTCTNYVCLGCRLPEVLCPWTSCLVTTCNYTTHSTQFSVISCISLFSHCTWCAYGQTCNCTCFIQLYNWEDVILHVDTVYMVYLSGFIASKLTLLTRVGYGHSPSTWSAANQQHYQLEYFNFETVRDTNLCTDPHILLPWPYHILSGPSTP